MRRLQIVLASVCLVGAGGLIVGAAGASNDAGVRAELRTRRLIVVDDKSVPRIILGQDPEDTQRRSRSAGITILDKTGAERGGMSTMDNGDVVLALDAPVGVGAPMRDRIGLVVHADGSSYVMLLDNETRAVAKLYSDGKGGGGPQLFQWDDKDQKVHVKTLGYEKNTVSTHTLDS